MAVVNPRQVPDFAKATGFGRAIRPEVRPLPDEASRELDALLDRRQPVGMRTMGRNRLAAGATGRVRRDLESHLRWLGEHMAGVNKEPDEKTGRRRRGRRMTTRSAGCRGSARS